MRNSVVCLAAGLMLFGSGCGGAPAKAKLYSVKGKVTAGKSLEGCILSFVSASGDGKIFGGKVGADGSYTLADSDGREGAEPGKYKVVLQQNPELQKQAMMSGAMSGGGPPKVDKPFPDEYSEATTSPVEKEVKAESNTIDVVIP